MMHFATDPNLIRHRAYELWLERGSPAGSPDHDWMNAERELGSLAAAAPDASAPVDVAPPVSSAPPPIARKPRRARAIVTRSPASPAAEALRALASESDSSLPESEVRATKTPAPRSRRAAQKRSA